MQWHAYVKDWCEKHAAWHFLIFVMDIHENWLFIVDIDPVGGNRTFAE
jgi:hypothetical protein